MNIYKICWVSEHADTPNPIISTNCAVGNIWPWKVVVGLGRVLVVLISIGTHSIDTYSHGLVLNVEMIPL